MKVRSFVPLYALRLFGVGRFQGDSRSENDAEM
jgi:hypothetical protein